MKRFDYFLCVLKINEKGLHFYSPFLTIREEGQDGTRVQFNTSSMRDDIPKGVFFYPADDYENCPKSAYAQLTGPLVKGQPQVVTEDQYADDNLWVIPSKGDTKAVPATK